MTHRMVRVGDSRDEELLAVVIADNCKFDECHLTPEELERLFTLEVGEQCLIDDKLEGTVTVRRTR